MRRRLGRDIHAGRAKKPDRHGTTARDKFLAARTAFLEADPPQHGGRAFIIHQRGCHQPINLQIGQGPMRKASCRFRPQPLAPMGAPNPIAKLRLFGVLGIQGQANTAKQHFCAINLARHRQMPGGAGGKLRAG